MKHWMLTAICIIGIFSLAGCSNNHLIYTTDGQIIEAADKPKIDDDTGMIEYKDESGRKNQISPSKVREIKER